MLVDTFRFEDLFVISQVSYPCMVWPPRDIDREYHASNKKKLKNGSCSKKCSFSNGFKLLNFKSYVNGLSDS